MKVFTENLNYTYKDYKLHFSFPIKGNTGDFKLGFGECTYTGRRAYFIAIDSYDIEHPKLVEGVNAILECRKDEKNNYKSEFFYGELAKKWNENGKSITEFIFLIGTDLSVLNYYSMKSYELIIPDMYYEKNTLFERFYMNNMETVIKEIEDFSKRNDSIRNDLWCFKL